MLLALALSACWRPAPYTPPPAPEGEDEPAAEESAEAVPEGEPQGEAGQEGGAAGEPGAEGAEEEGAPADEEDTPPFEVYTAHTVQAPVTLVDDWGKPLAVLGVPGFELEVRGEEPIRVRVWCAQCTPQVEGWIQPHLLDHVRVAPTGGSK